MDDRPTPAPPRRRGSCTTSTHDYSEANDLAGAHPEKLEQLKKEFDAAAARNNVFPIDPRVNERAHPNPPPPGGRAFYTFYPGATHLFDAAAPGTRNRTHTHHRRTSTFPRRGADGVLVADGGTASGYALYVKDGRPTYTYNYFRREVTTIAAPDRLPPGKARIDVRFAYDGGGEGKGATVTLTVNGKKAGEARLARTVPRVYTYDETFDVGEDTATPVGPYAAPFPFTGALERVELRAEPLATAVPPSASLDRDALREVARLIDVAAAADGDVVREQLQRQRHDDRRQQLRRARHLEDEVAAPGRGSTRASCRRASSAR